MRIDFIRSEKWTNTKSASGLETRKKKRVSLFHNESVTRLSCKYEQRNSHLYINLKFSSQSCIWATKQSFFPLLYPCTVAVNSHIARHASNHVIPNTLSSSFKMWFHSSSWNSGRISLTLPIYICYLMYILYVLAIKVSLQCGFGEGICWCYYV
jgi:hypothetical protein